MGTRNLEWSEGAAGPVLAALAAEQSQNWRDYAACAQTDPEAFFPPDGASSAAAKAVCRRCFVCGDCLEFALANPDVATHGIWGGTSARQRQRLARKRGAA